MLHVCATRFNVMENLKKFWQLNEALPDRDLWWREGKMSVAPFPAGWEIWKMKCTNIAIAIAYSLMGDIAHGHAGERFLELSCAPHLRTAHLSFRHALWSNCDTVHPIHWQCSVCICVRGSHSDGRAPRAVLCTCTEGDGRHSASARSPRRPVPVTADSIVWIWIWMHMPTAVTDDAEQRLSIGGPIRQHVRASGSRLRRPCRGRPEPESAANHAARGHG